MPTIVVRNVSVKTLKQLKAAATAHRRSLQAEVLDVLEQAGEAYRTRRQRPVERAPADAESQERSGTLQQMAKELADLRQALEVLGRQLPPVNAIGRPLVP